MGNNDSLQTHKNIEKYEYKDIIYRNSTNKTTELKENKGYFLININSIVWITTILLFGTAMIMCSTYVVWLLRFSIIR